MKGLVFSQRDRSLNDPSPRERVDDQHDDHSADNGDNDRGDVDDVATLTPAAQSGDQVCNEPADESADDVRAAGRIDALTTEAGDTLTVSVDLAPEA